MKDMTVTTQSATKPHTSTSVHLDAIRGLAAILVLMMHTRAFFFVGYKDALSHNFLVRCFYFFDGFGHPAVMVFFVLSGFLISSSVFRALESNRWSWGWYAQNRLTRLYVVLLPALVLGAFWDLLGMRLFGLHGVYGASATYFNAVPEAVNRTATPVIWLGNLFYLQTILVPPFGSNNPLWSLSFEFWYYVLFPLCLFAVTKAQPLRMRGLCAVAAILIAALIGKGILLNFFIWLMGTFLCFLPSLHRSLRRLLFPLAAVLLGAALLVERRQMLHDGMQADFFMAAAFTFFLYVIMNSESRVPVLYERLARFFSGISYTLYLVHVPFLFFVTAWMIGQKTLWQPDARHFGLGLIVVGMVFAYTYIVWRLAEAKTDKARKFITNRLSKTTEAKVLLEGSVS